MRTLLGLLVLSTSLFGVGCTQQDSAEVDVVLAGADGKADAINGRHLHVVMREPQETGTNLLGTDQVANGIVDVLDKNASKLTLSADRTQAKRGAAVVDFKVNGLDALVGAVGWGQLLTIGVVFDGTYLVTCPGRNFFTDHVVVDLAQRIVIDADRSFSLDECGVPAYRVEDTVVLTTPIPVTDWTGLGGQYLWSVRVR